MGRRPKYPELQDPDWLRARYVDDGLSMDQIAELVDFDCTSKTVGDWLRRHGVPVRPHTERAPNGRAKAWSESEGAAAARAYAPRGGW